MIRQTSLSPCCLFAALIATLPIAAAAREIPLPEARGDAELTDVFFLDADRGWAVGDRGVVWRTEDGGRNWTLQNSPTLSRLEAVQFINGEYGWAVGGAIGPFTHGTSAVILHTEDGGQQWQAVPTTGLPGLKQIHFFDGRRGWALGVGSALHPGAVFRSSDAGRGWAAVASDERQAWLSGDFASIERGMVVGAKGTALVSPTGLDSSATVDLEGRAIRNVKIASPGLAWAVGDGGLLLRSLDGGQSWTPPAGELPEAARSFDWRGLASLGEQVWVVGAPGAKVLHSPDAGRTWRLLPTGQTLPLSAVTFLDDGHGWAVGALGAILATRDGGQTWRVQRAGGQRLAMLGAFARHEHAPLALFARLSADEGYLSACEILSPASDRGATLGASAEDRVQAAFVACGASAARIASRTLSEEESQERLVRSIRQWRPEVVVTDDANPTDTSGERHAMNQLALAAIEMAADADAYPNHAAMGLGAWQVKRTYGLLPAGKPGSITLVPTQLAPRLGCTLLQTSAAGQALLAEAPRAASQVGFRLLANHAPRATDRTSERSADRTSAQGDFFGGLAGGPGESLRRTLGRPVAGNLSALKRLTQKRRIVETMLESEEPDRFGGDVWIAQVEDLGRGLEPQTAGELLHELASGYETRRPDLAAETWRVLVEQLPAHELCRAAWLKLAAFHSSEEVAHRFGRPPLRTAAPLDSVSEITPVVAMLPEIALATIDEAPAGALVEPATTLEQLRAEANLLPRKMRAAFSVAEPRIDAATQEIQRAQENRQRLASWATAIERRRPELFAEPSLRFPLSASGRQDWSTVELQQNYQSLAARATGDWRACALGELWLARPNQRPPKPVALSRTIAQRPYLDGKLDDSCWLDALPIELRRDGETDSQPTLVLMAHDDEFLYLAIEAPWLDTPEYRTVEASASRPRDAVLAGRDRLDLMLDVDRDYATSYCLSVDHRGFTRETCLDDESWNPTWYVASQESETAWRIEAAVRLADLVKQSPAPGDAWGFGARRWHGDETVQSWLADSEEGAGYLAGRRADTPERRFGYLRFD